MTATSPSRIGKPKGRTLTVVAVAAAIGYVMFGFLPAQKATNAKRRELQDKQQFIANANLKQSQAAQLESQLTEARNHVARWHEQSQTAGSPVAMLGEIDAVANAAGVVLHRLTPQDPTAFETLMQHTFSVEVEGSYAQVCAFLAGLESSPAATWIPKLAVGVAKQAGQNVQCALDITVFADNRGKSG